MTDRIDSLEAEIAHLTRTVEDLSAELHERSRRIETLERRVALLLEREAERQSEGPGGIVVGDERPPHW